MAHYSLTPRVKVLAERLLSQKSTLCTEHATTLNALDGDIAGVPAAVKPARRFYELMRQLPLCISADELIVGNQTRKPHGAIFHDESAVRRPSAFQFLNLNSELDSPDYKLVVEWKKEQRSQLVYISHEVDELDGLRLYNVFSPAHVFDDKEIDAALARRLLADNTKYKIGAWELAGKNLYYTSKIGTGLTANQLHGVIFTTGEVADNLELELSPAKDEL